MGILICPCCPGDWLIGMGMFIGIVPDFAGCPFAGMGMLIAPVVLGIAAGVVVFVALRARRDLAIAAGLCADALFAVGFFFAADFIFAAGLVGLGMCMPRMLIWASAGVETVAIANALAAVNSIFFTDILLGISR